MKDWSQCVSFFCSFSDLSIKKGMKSVIWRIWKHLSINLQQIKLNWICNLIPNLRLNKWRRLYLPFSRLHATLIVMPKGTIPLIHAYHSLYYPNRSFTWANHHTYINRNNIIYILPSIIVSLLTNTLPCQWAETFYTEGILCMYYIHIPMLHFIYLSKSYYFHP